MGPAAPVPVPIYPGTRACPVVWVGSAAPASFAPVAEKAAATAEIVRRVSDPALFRALGVWTDHPEANAANAAVEGYVMDNVVGPLVLQGEASHASLGPLLERVAAGDPWLLRNGRAGTTPSKVRLVLAQATHVLCEFAVPKLRDALDTPYCRFNDGDLQRAVDDVCARFVATPELMRDVKTFLGMTIGIEWFVNHEVAGCCGPGDCWMARIVTDGVTDEICELYIAQAVRRLGRDVTMRLLGWPPTKGTPRALVAAVKERARESQADALARTNEQVRERLGEKQVCYMYVRMHNWTRKMVEVEVEVLRMLFDCSFAATGGNLVRLFTPVEMFLPTRMV